MESPPASHDGNRRQCRCGTQRHCQPRWNIEPVPATHASSDTGDVTVLGLPATLAGLDKYSANTQTDSPQRRNDQVSSVALQQQLQKQVKKRSGAPTKRELDTGAKLCNSHPLSYQGLLIDDAGGPSRSAVNKIQTIVVSDLMMHMMTGQLF